MRGAERVNDEFEVGFNQTFESRWYRAEQAGRVAMIAFSLAAGLGLLGRGPFSHDTTQSANGALAFDYEPIARYGTGTTVTVHIRKPQEAGHPVELRVGQHIIEPTGFQRAVPLANRSSVSDDGMRRTFNEAARQSDVLGRFEPMPKAVGFILLYVSDGVDSINWSILVVP